MTSLANPSLAVFFVALFPQFVPTERPFFRALVMAAIIVGLDLVWDSALADLVTRAEARVRGEALAGALPAAYRRRADRARPAVSP